MVPIVRRYAQRMRNYPTPAEKYLWRALRCRRIDGWIFRRQHRIGDFIVDFYCPALKLVIEADGGYHNTERQKTKDQLRDTWFVQHGFSVLRFTNAQILTERPAVLSAIRAWIQRTCECEKR